MISKELMDFFDDCMTVGNSYSRSWLIDDPNWTAQRSFDFSHGVILGLYREKNPSLLSLMGKQYENNELYRLLCKAVDQTNTMSKKMFDDCGRNPASAPVQQYPAKEQNLVEWYRGYNSCMIEQLSSEDEDSIISFLYIYHAYEEYRADRDVHAEEKQPNIHKVHQDETDDDFCDWNLVPVIDVHRILKAYN